MAVLAEAVSIIAPVATIRLRLAGGMAAFQALVPNESFACDGEVARVGFMASEDAVGFMAVLQGLGFWFVHNGQAVDCVFTDQVCGPTVPCPWLGFGMVTVEGDRMPAAWLAGSTPRTLHGPVGWRFAGSLSESFVYVTPEGMAKTLVLVERQDGADVYRDRLTGVLHLMGRAGPRR